MPRNTQTSYAACNAQADALGTRLNNGYLRGYTGTQPANADAPVVGTLLFELRFAATAFGPAVNGVITANAMVAEDAALAAGTVTWFRTFESDGTTVVYDDNAGTGDEALVLESASIPENANVSITDLTYEVPRA